MISGRGWGHGVGMSQWGAYGYAKHGVTYDKILAHYYPGTKLAPAPVAKIKVLLVEAARSVVVSSPDPFSRPGRDRRAPRPRPGATTRSTPTLTVTLDPDGKPAAALPGPLTFLPGKSPLWLAHPYRGSFIVTATGKSLSVVNLVALDAYVRGVVSSEMPKDWPLEAVKAQAVAARSYALAHKRGGAFDVYNDTRDQVYGGIAAETPVGDEAVADDRPPGAALRRQGRETFFFSSSGGRTAAITDVFTGAKPMPVPRLGAATRTTPHSPYHTWGPLTMTAAAVGHSLGVAGLDRRCSAVPATGRARGRSSRSGEERRCAVLGRRRPPRARAALDVDDDRRALARPRPVGDLRCRDERDAQRQGGAAWRSPTLEQRASRAARGRPGPALDVQPDGSFSVAVAPTGDDAVPARGRDRQGRRRCTVVVG